MQVRGAILGGATALLVLGACDDGDRAKYALEGSLGQVMDLGYDEIRVQIAPQDVSLLFVRKHQLNSIGLDAGNGGTGTSEDYPLKVGFNTLDLDGGLPMSGTLDLTELDGNGNQRGVLSRNVQGDPRTTFPKIRIGGWSVDAPIVIGATLHGEFHVTFENGTEVASGRTVFTKSYTATVQP